MREQDSSGYDPIFKLMKESKKTKTTLCHVEATASSAVKTACDIGAKAIVVLTETGETGAHAHASAHTHACTPTRAHSRAHPDCTCHTHPAAPRRAPSRQAVCPLALQL